MVNSLVAVRAPQPVMDEGGPTSKGRDQPPVDRFVTPGARKESIIGLPSFNGSSAMRRWSTTAPSEADAASLSGDSPETFTLSVACPTWSVILRVLLSATRTRTPFSTEVLKPVLSAETL